MLAMLNSPSWLKPEIIPGLPFRWYGLMYVVAFLITWVLFRYESKREKKPWTEETAANFFLWSIIGILIGGRLGGTLIYEPTNYYWTHPWMILWPFDESGAFVGYQGMSFHGGLVGLIAATLIWCKVKKGIVARVGGPHSCGCAPWVYLWAPGELHKRRALGQGHDGAMGDGFPRSPGIFG